MQVEYLATINLPDEGWDVNTLEEACLMAARNTARELFLRALRQVEKKVLAKVKGEKKGEVRRYLMTKFGLITFFRQKLKRRENGKNSYFYPLDRNVGLGPRQQTTLWVRKRACELATRYTYREAAVLLSAEVGDEVSHYPIHRWVQKKGKVLRQGEDKRRQATFDYGEIIETEAEPIEEAQEFGEKLYLEGEGKLALSKAKNLLIIGDGDQWIRGIAQGPYFMATYQIDWRHVLVKVQQTFNDQPGLVSELVDYLYSGKGKDMLDTIKLARLLCEDNERRKKITDLADYIENNFNGLCGSRSLKDRVEAKEVLVTCSGAMEKNIDVVIGRRFKKPGMSWTKEGANNLLKLRILCYDKNDWQEFWEKQKFFAGRVLPPIRQHNQSWKNHLTVPGG